MRNHTPNKSKPRSNILLLTACAIMYSWLQPTAIANPNNTPTTLEPWDCVVINSARMHSSPDTRYDVDTIVRNTKTHPRPHHNNNCNANNKRATSAREHVHEAKNKT